MVANGDIPSTYKSSLLTRVTRVSPRGPVTLTRDRSRRIVNRDDVEIGDDHVTLNRIDM